MGVERSEEGGTCGNYLVSLHQTPPYELCFVSCCIEEFKFRAESANGFNGKRVTHYGWPQSLDHETGKIRCIQTDAANSEQST